jgi:hypothetical protein
MISKPLGLEPGLDRDQQDLSVHLFLGRERLWINLVQDVPRGVESIEPALVGLDRRIIEPIAESLIADEDRRLERMSPHQVGPVSLDDRSELLTSGRRGFGGQGASHKYACEYYMNEHGLNERTELHKAIPKSLEGGDDSVRHPDRFA